MYCSSCGVAVAQGLSYCNFCGATITGGQGDGVAKPPAVQPGLLVSAIVGLFILGLVAIAILTGVMKAVAGFDIAIVLAITMLAFMLLVIVEGVLIGMLLKGKRAPKKPANSERLNANRTKGLDEAPARALPEPVASVTEHTTRAFDPIYRERKSE